MTLDAPADGASGNGHYHSFLAGKRQTVPAVGLNVEESAIHELLFPFQRALTKWALRKGRAAIFADTGLGKTFMQLEWARLSGEDTLIIAPLSVARQTVKEAARIGIDIGYSRDGAKAGALTITNYEMVGHFDPGAFGAVVLDESSILKSLDGKTRRKLTAMFGDTRFRLCCTATPAPNDITELANHAEFLGIMSRQNMLAAFFVHTSNGKITDGWRLKGHAVDPFYKWLASWGMSVRKPSDLGFKDDGYDLPELTIAPSWVEGVYVPEGQMFATKLHGVGDRARARRATLDARVARTAELANGDAAQWILWCGLNDEGRALAALIPDAVLVEGKDTPESKAAAIEGFQDGEHRVLITKPRIAGFGMNLQNCDRMAFVGLSDSWEAYYQCIRRCWRFGQERPVTAHIVLSDAEQAIYENVKRKEKEAERMAEELIGHVGEFEKEQIAVVEAEGKYEEDESEGDGYRLMLGDSVERMREVEGASIDLSIFSPPFMSLYTYSPTERDLGNAADPVEFFTHFGYIIDELHRVTKPGRNCAVHVAQVPATVVHDGYTGLKDFRGDVIRAFEGRKWTYHGEVCIDKDPQAQAIRTHSKGLLFVQLRRDASWLRPAMADYVLVFRKPGENAVPVLPDISNDDWIEWARPIWYGIRETETLNAREGRDNKDERHIAPLQLGTIERAIRLWSNRGETVLSPFAGIGSEGYVAVQHGRRFVGIELKASYYRAARRNLARAVTLGKGQALMPLEGGT